MKVWYIYYMGFNTGQCATRAMALHRILQEAKEKYTVEELEQIKTTATEIKLLDYEARLEYIKV